MTDRWLPLAALALAGALTACATTPPAQVTRFHLNEPIARGSIAVRPLDSGEANGLEFQTYKTAIADELARQGFTVRPDLPADQVATLDVQRGIRPSAGSSRSPVSVGVGGGTFGDGLGIGIGTSFGLGGKRYRDTAVTTMAVQIKRASDGRAVWEGRVVGTTDAKTSPGDEARRLAAALFKDFPGRSGETVEVKTK